MRARGRQDRAEEMEPQQSCPAQGNRTGFCTVLPRQSLDRAALEECVESLARQLPWAESRYWGETQPGASCQQHSQQLREPGPRFWSEGLDGTAAMAWPLSCITFLVSLAHYSSGLFFL